MTSTAAQRRRAVERHAAEVPEAEAERFGRALAAFVADHWQEHGRGPAWGWVRRWAIDHLGVTGPYQEFTARMGRAHRDGWVKSTRHPYSLVLGERAAAERGLTITAEGWVWLRDHPEVRAGMLSALGAGEYAAVRVGLAQLGLQFSLVEPHG